MPRGTKPPSFVVDPDQAAELAALLRDNADEAEDNQRESEKAGEFSSRAYRTGVAQRVARWRRWADELAPEQPVEPARPPLQIRPAEAM